MAIVRANGLDFHVSRFRTGAQGGRPVVVGLHGLAVVDSSSLGMTLGMPLAKSFDVILYDLRGHGRSQAVASGLGVSEHVGDFVALLDELGVDEPVHLLVGSYSGSIGVMIAHEHPERLKSLSMVDPTLPVPYWGSNLALSLEHFGKKLRTGMGVDQLMAVYGVSSRRRAAMLAERARRLLLESSMIDELRAERALSPEEFGSIRVPILAVFGEISHLSVLAQVLGEQVPHAEIHNLPGVNHIAAFHQPETRAAIQDFIGRVEAQQAAGVSTG